MKTRLFVASLWIALCLCGCDVDDKKANDLTRPSGVEEAPPGIQNSCGQTIQTVLLNDFREWLNEHKTNRIVTLCPVCTTGSECNPTTAIIIVYETK